MGVEGGVALNLYTAVRAHTKLRSRNIRLQSGVHLGNIGMKVDCDISSLEALQEASGLR